MSSIYRFIGPVSLTVSSSGAMASTNTITSAPMDLLTITGAAFYISWTGTPTGTLSVQGSLDGTNYADIGASISSQPAGGTGSNLLNLVDLMFRYVRVSYTNASGSGTLSVSGSAKTK